MDLDIKHLCSGNLGLKEVFVLGSVQFLGPPLKILLSLIFGQVHNSQWSTRRVFSMLKCRADPLAGRN